MQLLIEQKRYYFENDVEVLDQLFAEINTHIEKSNKYFSHLLVDGVEVFEQHDTYMKEHISNLDQIEVVLKSIQELIEETLLSTNHYITRAIPEIEELAEQFYNHPDEAAWMKFDQLLQGLQWMIEMMQLVDQNNQYVSNWKEYISSTETLKQQLTELLEAVENKDMVLLADIIQYELLPVLEQLKQHIENSINN
ncbi:hypothetical protein [Gracilibacillus alcaliphilus]|uniref:hypothetical protein n=1 Tax=Gracilibacillus alcaliphilus TaxID=1401441 RepID=UPI00195B7AE1|nr:hypothetical protein [Gracilibacillus alcaliphilus]MBM7676026.1 putative PurR-regulated permease PerM [Gracilibacillus alcaliphilus]